MNVLLHSNVCCNAKNASFVSEALTMQAVASCLSKDFRAVVFDDGDERGEASYAKKNRLLSKKVQPRVRKEAKPHLKRL